LGIQFLLKTKVTDVTVKGAKGTVSAETSTGEAITLTADKVLMAVGRRPYTEGCGLDTAGVVLTERGRVQTDSQLRTNIPSISAIGDLIDGPMLAHKAEEEGYAVAELIADERQTIVHAEIPGVIYTHPEIACAGLGKDAAKDQGKKVAIGKFEFMANGRAKAAADQDGFVTVVADPDDDFRLLGATVVGPHASDLIAELSSVLAFDGTLKDIALTCHAHPTYSEAVKEAALAGLKAPLHS
jgi:dihydrolipoamide dehydrogenase